MPAATAVAAEWLRQTPGIELTAVGHRVVHGGPDYDRPVLIDKNVLARLERYVALAPLHQPNNLAVIRSLLALRPGLAQIACFDTAFHRSHSAVVDHYAIPEQFYREGVRRCGFHGLSYEYIAARLNEIAPDVVKGRVIVAHLGSGASMIEHFVYRIGLNVGLLAAALGGLDAFVFTAGIGENSPMIRSRVAEKLVWLGARCDPTANNAARLVISHPHSKLGLYVVPTDEELMIARHALSLIAGRMSAAV